MEQQQQNQTICYSAPGKTILSGEHSVVYYKDAIAMAIDLRTNVLIKLQQNTINQQNQPLFKVDILENQKIEYEINFEEFQIILNMIDVNLQNILNFEEFSQKIKENQNIKLNNLNENQQQSKIGLIYIFYFISIFILQQLQNINKEINIQQILTNYTLKSQQSNIQINISSNLPISKGLGSSASYNVALSASIYDMIKLIMLDKNEQNSISFNNFQDQQKIINQISFELEKIYHGTPSGIDNYVATYGGLVVFNKNKSENELIKGFNLPYDIYLIDSMVEKDTKKAVQKVRQVYDDKILGTIGKGSIDLISEVTNQFANLMRGQIQNLNESELETLFMDLVNINQSLLRLFTLSNHQIELIQAESMKFNIPCKITGAGKGGYCLAFIPKKLEKQDKIQYLKNIENQGFTYMEASFSQNGLQKEIQNEKL